MKLLKSQISNNQRAKIYALAKEAGIDNSQLHELMGAWCKCSSLKYDSCSSAQANIIIESLNEIVNGKISNFGAAAVLSEVEASAPGMATDKQKNAILSISADMDWNSKRLTGFIYHTVNKYDVDRLTSHEATKVITGLKNMLTTTKTR